MLTMHEITQLVFNEKRLIIDNWDNISIDVLKSFFETSPQIKEIILLNVPSDETAIKVISILPNTIRELVLEGGSLGDRVIESLTEKMNDTVIEEINFRCPKLTNSGLENFFNLLERNDTIIKRFYLHAGDASLEKATRFLYDLMESDLKLGATYGVSDESSWTYNGLITINESPYTGEKELLEYLSQLYLLMKRTGAYGLLSIEGLFNITEFDENRYKSYDAYLGEKLTIENIYQHIKMTFDQLTEQKFQEYFGITQSKEKLIPRQRSHVEEQGTSELLANSIFSGLSKQPISIDEHHAEESDTKRIKNS
jgi:hypothetical protein